ncbi:MAG: hypothetical protein NTY93_00195 [Candidatus Kaiserbacteria bacterium]|nr:hypothetical protein [Candidatus Kaiserbacteria bacterium]
MLPPSIPTSFVPHSAAAPRRFRSDFTGAFGILMYIVLGIVFALALGIFFYGQILSANQMTKDAALAQAQSTINSKTVEDFVRLRDRLASGESLLANHTAFSGFFSSLSTLMPATVRFSSLHLSLEDKGTVKFEGSGVAKNFNALAVASMAFAKDERIKDAIFSNIVVSPKDNSVSFALAATLNPEIIAFKVPVAVPITTSTSVSTSTSAITATSSGQTDSSQPTP